MSDEEVTEATRRFKKKARFLTDEDLHAETVPYLRDKGWNLKTAKETKLVGHSDEDYVALAQKEDRLLLTHDRGYLSDRKFPPGQQGGVLVLPGGSGDTRALVQALLDMLSVIAPYWNAYRGSKIEFQTGRTITMRSRDGQSGSMTSTRYRLRPNAVPEIWSDE